MDGISIRMSVYNEEILKKIMDTICNLHSNVFSTKTISNFSGIPAMKICHHMPHLLSCGAVDVSPYRRKLIYRRRFEKEDIERLLSAMKKNDVKRRRKMSR